MITRLPRLDQTTFWQEYLVLSTINTSKQAIIIRIIIIKSVKQASTQATSIPIIGFKSITQAINQANTQAS